MDIKQLEEKWKGLTASSKGYNSLRMDANCLPDLFVSVWNSNTRCLILKLPEQHKSDFQSAQKENLSLEFFPETKWIVLKLLDPRFTDLFNDLILSIYNKIWDKNNVWEYSTELVTTFYKWSEFFSDRDAFRLSEEKIRGIFGELIVLKEQIPETPAANLNELLSAWKGPWHNRHDFIFGQTDLEVKTKENSAIDILISSEFQLAPEPGKALELAVVSLKTETAGLSLRDLLLDIMDLISSRGADFSLILKGLSTFGLSPRSLKEYDDYRYTPVSLDGYDCSAPGFPKITPADISPAITQVNYYLRVTALKEYCKSSKPL